MKTSKFTLFILLFSFSLLISCSKDEENENPAGNNVNAY